MRLADTDRKTTVRARSKPVTDVPSFLERVYSLSSAHGIRCFRGEADATWKLKPSAMRGLKKDAEKNIISELTLEAPSDFQGDGTMFRRLVRAQHYGLPTRLLDVSLNPLVALFFACNDEKSSKSDGSVLILDFKKSRIKFADSDAVSILCNLSILDDDEKDAINRTLLAGRRRKKGSSATKIDINEMAEVDRLVQFIKMEKSYFRKDIDPRDLKTYFFVHPPKNNRRIIAQSGAFVVAGLLEYTNTENAYSFSLTKIKIKSEYKAKILEQLDEININKRTLFPEIEFTASYIKDKWSDKKTSESNGADAEDYDIFL